MSALAGFGAGLTRQRVAFIAGAALAAWIVVVFARQAGDASAATARAATMRADNAALAAEVAGLRDELTRVQQAPFVAQQAHAYKLGAPNERPFSLAPGAPALAPDAPGSAAVRLGARRNPPTPFERWLDALFGPGTGT